MAFCQRKKKKDKNPKGYILKSYFRVKLFPSTVLQETVSYVCIDATKTLHFCFVLLLFLK